MNFPITQEYRNFIKGLRNERKVSTYDITIALGKKSAATYNNIENSSVKNSLKTIDINSIFKIFGALNFFDNSPIPYKELEYETKYNYSDTAREMISSFTDNNYCTDLKQQLWLLAFGLECVYYEVPQDILKEFEMYKKENGLDDKGFFLMLNKNFHLLSVRGFKDTNIVEIKSDIDGNYLDWVIKYNLTEDEKLEKYIKYFRKENALPYHLIYSLLFACYYSVCKNKSEASKMVLDKLRKNGIYTLIDKIKGTVNNINNIEEKTNPYVEKMLEIVSGYIKEDETAEKNIEKIIINMENKDFFEIMSMPIFATLVHFTDSKLTELKEMITRDITTLL